MATSKAGKKTLIIVESPTKAKTISRFLPSSYNVQSSFGHIRDLPKSKIGVDLEKNFEPTYTIPDKAKKTVAALKSAASKAEEVILATDEDREGEAIAWHITEAVKLPADKTKRIVFHEITKTAIEKALAEPRQINFFLVNAQQARRILDRLVGYKMSPFLWKKVTRGLSAGRVQSVAVRLIVDREREIQKFKADEYWKITAVLDKDGNEFTADLFKKDGKTIPKLGIKNKKEAEAIVKEVSNTKFEVSEVVKKETKRSPRPPFITSTLQQEAARKLGYSAKQTMMLAQQLYEGVEISGEATGLITYMRTDSVNIANEAIKQAGEVITKDFGSKYYIGSRVYSKKSKHAQEAHESIRPTSFLRNPESVQGALDARQFKLYDLIWKRALASQMADALVDSTTVDVAASKYILRARGSIVKFDGFTKVYTESKDNGNDNSNGVLNEAVLPELNKNDELKLVKITPSQHFTEPPARFTEASLVKALEVEGIGRPSTYAPIMSTIVDRGYVTKEEKKFHPTDVAYVVIDLLVEHFPQIVDLKFTAGMEENLDKVAEDKLEWQKLLQDFYIPLEKLIAKKEDEVNKEDLTQEKTDEKCEKCGKPMIIKLGRFGKFLACTGYPDCKTTKPIGEEKVMQEEASGEKCEKCGADMVVKRGRFGPFLGCSKYPDCKNIKPIEKSTGAKCPECKKGEIIEKRSKKGRTFYACNRYPKCENAMWQKPTGEECPDCKSLLVYAAGNKIKCSSKECDFEKDIKED
ncbi:MAG: type I DNA topoisomerase [bacterium]